MIEHAVVIAGGGPTGLFYAAWSDSSTGVFQIHFAAVRVSRPPSVGK